MTLDVSIKRWTYSYTSLLCPINLTSLERTDESNLWTLYVTKIDILSPEKLHKRNLAFDHLADHCCVELYDAWDVEKI